MRPLRVIPRLVPRLVPEPVFPLAALRVVVPIVVLLGPEVRRGPELAAVPAALRVAPEGLGWFVNAVPIDRGVALVAQVVCVFAGLCAAAGVRARPALVAQLVAAFYLFAVYQLGGAVWHDMHLLWLLALLAASPCDEALGFDARGCPPPPDSTRYAWPLLFARLLLGAVYFFPGVHKLATSGLAWALSDNLRNQLWWKWAEHGADPSAVWRVDSLPGVLHAGGLFVLAFELSFPVLALVPRTRAIAAALGVVFHLFTQLVFLIPFWGLWACYVALLAPRRTRVLPAVTPPASASRAPIAVGALLVAGAVVQGARGRMAAFPFACYPTFAWIAGTEMPDLEIDVAGTTLPRAARSQRGWGETWSALGVTGPLDCARLAAFARRTSPAVARADPREVRYVRAWRSVDPDRRGDPPLRREPLCEGVTR